MSDTLGIGDTSKDGLLTIVNTSENNGTLYVTVRENIGGGAWTNPASMVRRARRLARRALDHPERQTSSRLVRHVPAREDADRCDRMTFAVRPMKD